MTTALRRDSATSSSVPKLPYRYGVAAANSPAQVSTLR
jgi:hypothetical protein